ncbi:hemerythrin domain-containing protein [Streptomyces sp. NPDC058646]|uniref:hemerythrin domain-containing protein n=1 Tax=Streptomyces sp. NPDC058646 TaxID=3346574 RepID=UPI003661CE1B
MGHGGDLIAELTADHREVDDLFGVIERTPYAAARLTAAEQLTIELVRHAVAEEEHLYPVVREHLPDGDLVADKGLADHGRVERILKDLEGIDAAGPDRDRLVAGLKAEITAHVWDAEENLFPRLRQACPQETLDALGDDVRRVKRRAPSPPRPGSPPSGRRPTPGPGLVERARELVTGRGR